MYRHFHEPLHATLTKMINFACSFSWFVSSTCRSLQNFKISLIETSFNIAVSSSKNLQIGGLSIQDNMTILLSQAI